MSFEIGLTIGMTKSANYQQMPNANYVRQPQPQQYRPQPQYQPQQQPQPQPQQQPQQQPQPQQGTLRSMSPYLMGAGLLGAVGGSGVQMAALHDAGGSSGKIDKLWSSANSMSPGNLKGVRMADALDDVAAKITPHMDDLTRMKGIAGKGRMAGIAGLGLAGLGGLGYLMG